MQKVLLAICWGMSLWLTAQTQPFTSNLPLLFIDTEGQAVPDEPKITARLRIIDNGPGTPNRTSDRANNYDGFIGIELRGSTSQTLFPKKGFGIETRDAEGNDLDVALLGMPEEEDWVLHGPYSDKSLIRNALAYTLAGKVMAYAPRVRLVELFINNDYRGIYLFTEKIKRDKHRIDISKLSEDENEGDDLTGGYVLKLDKTTGDDPSVPLFFTSRYGSQISGGKEVRYLYDYPAPEDITQPQRLYIQNFIRDFERSVASRDPDGADSYRDYIDLQSFVDHMLITEIGRNVDGYRLSTWLYKDKDSRGGRLHMGPVWDYNLAFGNANYCQGERTQGWAYDFNIVCPDDFWFVPFWWRELRQDHVFRNRWRNRWNELRTGPLSDRELERTIDSLVAEIGPAAERNFRRWPVLDTYIWPNQVVSGSYAAEVDYLRNWLLERVNWMDGNIDFLTATPAPAAVGLLQLVPNPTAGRFELWGGPELRIAETQVYDGAGRRVRVGGPGQRELDLTGLPGGVYQVMAVTDDRRMLVGRVVLR